MDSILTFVHHIRNPTTQNTSHCKQNKACAQGTPSCLEFNSAVVWFIASRTSYINAIMRQLKFCLFCVVSLNLMVLLDIIGSGLVLQIFVSRRNRPFSPIRVALKWKRHMHFLALLPILLLSNNNLRSSDMAI